MIFTTLPCRMLIGFPILSLILSSSDAPSGAPLQYIVRNDDKYSGLTPGNEDRNITIEV